MISDVKNAIKNKLTELYPTGCVVYDEDLPETISKPSFLLQITSQNYNRRTGNRFSSELTFDVSYFSDQSAVRTDCIAVQENLLQTFDLIGTYQVRNKVAKITDNVLHFTFDIRYSEIVEEEICYMQQQQTNTKL